MSTATATPWRRMTSTRSARVASPSSRYQRFGGWGLPAAACRRRCSVGTGDGYQLVGLMVLPATASVPFPCVAEIVPPWLLLIVNDDASNVSASGVALSG